MTFYANFFANLYLNLHYRPSYKFTCMVQAAASAGASALGDTMFRVILFPEDSWKELFYFWLMAFFVEEHFANLD